MPLQNLNNLQKVTFVLDLHLTDRSLPATGSIQLGIFDPESFLSLSFYTLDPGYETLAKITPLVQTISKDAINVDVEKRKKRIKKKNTYVRVGKNVR